MHTKLIIYDFNNSLFAFKWKFLWNLTRILLIIFIIEKNEIFRVAVNAQFFNQVEFDCKRLHPRYCCSTRVRFSCPQLCQQFPCNGPFSLGQQRKKL